jgi:hypothetical protein
MKSYLLNANDEFFHLLKVESAKVDLTMKEFIIQSVKEKIENGSRKENEKEK